MSPDRVAPADGELLQLTGPSNYARSSFPSREGAGAWKDLVDTLWRPSDIFRRRTGADAWLALLVFVIVAGLFAQFSATFFADIAESELRQQVLLRSRYHLPISLPHLRRVMRLKTEFAGTAQVVEILARVVVLAVITWMSLILTRQRRTLALCLSVTVYAAVPMAVSILANVLQVIVLPTSVIYDGRGIALSATRFFGTAEWPLWLRAAMSELDAIGIWELVITGIGLVHRGRLTRPQAVRVMSVVLALSMIFVALNAWTHS